MFNLWFENNKYYLWCIYFLKNDEIYPSFIIKMVFPSDLYIVYYLNYFIYKI
jgi:hypothetical protein